MIVGDHLAYKDLPLECKKALAEYMYCENAFEAEKLLNDRFFRLEMIPVEEAKRLCMETSEDLREAFSTFEEYHREYLAWGDVEDHGTSRWPCIGPGEDEWLLDGWHRFHSYIRAGDKYIPLVSFI